MEKETGDNGVWKPLIEKSSLPTFSSEIGLLSHQKLMIATDVSDDDDEIRCPFMDNFGKPSTPGNLHLCLFLTYLVELVLF